MDFKKLSNLVESTDELTEEIMDTLKEFVDYNSTGMRVEVTRNLTAIRERIENGDVIKYYKTEEELNIGNFKPIVLDAFGEEIYEDVFGEELD